MSENPPLLRVEEVPDGSLAKLICSMYPPSAYVEKHMIDKVVEGRDTFDLDGDIIPSEIKVSYERLLLEGEIGHVWSHPDNPRIVLAIVIGWIFPRGHNAPPPDTFELNGELFALRHWSEAQYGAADNRVVDISTYSPTGFARAAQG